MLTDATVPRQSVVQRRALQRVHEDYAEFSLSRLAKAAPQSRSATAFVHNIVCVDITKSSLQLHVCFTLDFRHRFGLQLNLTSNLGLSLGAESSCGLW